MPDKTAREFLVDWCRDARATLAAATPGPWEYLGNEFVQSQAGIVADCFGLNRCNGAAIVLARNSLEALVEFVEAALKCPSIVHIANRNADVKCGYCGGLTALATKFGWTSSAGRTGAAIPGADAAGSAYAEGRGE